MIYLSLLRPRQWLKNTFVMVPIFFSGDISFDTFIMTLGGGIAFILLSSIIYILNDWRDMKSDRQHKKKKMRPLASGAISPAKAFLVALVLMILIIGFCIHLNLEVQSIYLLLLYASVNISYSIGLKQVPILELMLVASGFIIRLMFGASIISITLSPWILVCTGLLSLMLAVGKRRGDLVQENDVGLSRKSLSGYNLAYLDQLNAILAASTITAYVVFCTSVYAVEKFGNEVILSAPFVIYGILKYLNLLMVDKLGDDPTSLIISNSSMRVVLIGWTMSFIAIIYF